MTDNMSAGWAIVASLAPTILLGLVFWAIMRSILRADRTERKVYAEIEAEERARFDAEHSPLRDASNSRSSADQASIDTTVIDPEYRS